MMFKQEAGNIVNVASTAAHVATQLGAYGPEFRHADAFGFLASDVSAYINGQDIVVDGGLLKASPSNLYSIDWTGTEGETFVKNQFQRFP